jgi:DNA-binding beta-propeller fold protein YncE
MFKVSLAIFCLLAVPAAAQDYTVLAISHLDNKVTEHNPRTGQMLRQFVIMPGQWEGELHEGAITADGKTMCVSAPYSKQVIILDLDTFKQRGAIQSPHFSRPLEVRSFARIGRRESSSSDPHGVALNRDETKLYITLEFAQVPGIAVYDVKAGRVTTKIDTVVPGNYLWGHPKTDKLYFPTRRDLVVVVDTKTDRVAAVIPTEPGSRPNGVAFGGPNDEVWVNGDGDGSVTVIDAYTDKVIKVIKTRVRGAGRVAVSPDGRLAAATQGKDTSVIDTRTKDIVATLTHSPDDTGHGFPVFSPDGNTLHVMSEYSNDMVAFDMKTLKQIGPRVPVGGAVFGGGIRVAGKR